MRTQTIGFSASLLVHGAFALLLYSLAMVVPEAPIPVVIDLSLLAGPQATPPSPTPVASPLPPPPARRAPAPVAVPEAAQEQVVRQQVVQPRKRKRVVAKAAVIPEAVQLPAAAVETVEERAEELTAVLDPPREAEAQPLQPQALPDIARPAMVSGAGEAASEHGASSPAASTGGGPTLTPEARWRQEHFSAIKEAIRKNMVYPAVARRNGWQGRVLVSFVICLDGRVDEIRIEESSGFSLLDKNAVTIIKQSAPFPSPPVRATLIVPIDYSLG